MSQPQSKVGIFWYFEGKLLKGAVPLEKGERSAGSINATYEHARFWDVLKIRVPGIRALEYDQVPRGRVVYLEGERQFAVYLDKVLLRPAVKRLIVQMFELPAKSTIFERDPHYTTDSEELDRLFDED